MGIVCLYIVFVLIFTMSLSHSLRYRVASQQTKKKGYFLLLDQMQELSQGKNRALYESEKEMEEK